MTTTTSSCTTLTLHPWMSYIGVYTSRIMRRLWWTSMEATCSWGHSFHQTLCCYYFWRFRTFSSKVWLWRHNSSTKNHIYVIASWSLSANVMACLFNMLGRMIKARYELIVSATQISFTIATKWGELYSLKSKVKWDDNHVYVWMFSFRVCRYYWGSTHVGIVTDSF